MPYVLVIPHSGVMHRLYLPEATEFGIINIYHIADLLHSFYQLHLLLYYYYYYYYYSTRLLSPMQEVAANTHDNII